MDKFAHLPKTSGIYKITNTQSNKCYIGSSVNIRKRCREHIIRLKNKSHPNDYLQNSFNKYGELNFIFEVVENVLDFNNLLIREGFFICSLSPQYNLAKLDLNGFKTLSEETKKKIGVKSAEKFVKNPELKYILKNARNEKPVWNKGKKGIYSKETLEKMSKSSTVRNLSRPKEQFENFIAAAAKRAEKKRKPVLQFSKDMEFIKEWESINAVGRYLGKGTRNIVSGIKCNKIRYDYYIYLK